MSDDIWKTLDREAQARSRGVRKEIAVRAVCWIMTLPLWPALLIWALAESESADQFGYWWGGKIKDFAERHGVRFPS